MEQISPSVWVETGYPGVNVGAIVTEDGIVFVDAPTRPVDMVEWIARVRALGEGPVRYLILTDYHCDRVLTAHAVRARIVAQEATQAKLISYDGRLPTPVLDGLAVRYNLARKELNSAVAIQPQISFCDRAAIYLGGCEIALIHVPSATPGSLWVYLRQEQILFAGDSVVVDQHPVLTDAETAGWLRVLARLQSDELPVKTVVPGRGALCDRSAVAAVASFVIQAQEQVGALYRAGRPRADTATLVPEFLSLFPPGDAPRDWLQRQLKVGLDHIYDEFKAADVAKARP